MSGFTAKHVLMKSSALRQFRRRIAEDKPVYGLWVTLESASITEMAVALGLDWVVIDAEHGQLDWRDILAHVRAAVRSSTVVLVRIAELNIALVKRALDIGADGVVVPWIETPQQLEQAVAFAHYPQRGLRGIGAERATCWGQCLGEHVDEAEENVLVVPIIESVLGGQNIHQLVEVDGADVFFFGPADFSATAGYVGQWEGPGVSEQILAAKDAIRAVGKRCGVVATGNDNLIERRDQGFSMLGLGLDGPLFLRSLYGALAAVGRDRRITPALSHEGEPDQEAVRDLLPLARPPESMRPDRPEVISSVGSNPKTEIQPEVMFESLVGPHNQARDLNTGFVTLAPGAQLRYHCHPYSESFTLISGESMIEVEGRRYTLRIMDNVVVPSGIPHQVSNPSNRQAAVFHVAMAAAALTHTPVDRFFSRRAMPDNVSGSSGASSGAGERVNRFATARREVEGLNTTLVYFFDERVIPGIEMSGGYGLFQPTGRLPAHVHDFDESICIIEGTATCVVEGRRYTLSDGATALQPRGRVHYFVNETDHPMAMLWFYAGPRPERLVVDERSATVANVAWPKGERSDKPTP